MFTAPLLFKMRSANKAGFSPEESQDRGVQAAPNADAMVQRKCAQCEEEESGTMEGEEEMIQRKERTAAWSMQGLETKLHGERGQGFVLPTSTQNMMERNIGADFSQVRLHTGKKAVQMNRQLNSRAFTHGSDIYFNQGEYQPQGPTGQHLLAHELTHVVQQGAAAAVPNIQRNGPTDPSFTVTGVEDVENQRDNFIYFGLDSYALTADEGEAVDEFLASHQDAPEIHLYGYASEEGRARHNRILIDNRMEAVANRLRNPVRGTAYAGTIHQHSRLDVSSNNIRYRRFRSVEISLAGSVITGTGRGRVDTRDCTTTENDVIDTARDANIEMIGNAITRLREYQSDPDAHEHVGQTLDNNFLSHSTETVERVLAFFTDILASLNSLSGDSHRQCADDDYNPCLRAGALTHRGQVTFCPIFFSPPSRLFNESYPDEPSLQRMILSHEMGHYIDNGLPDRSYTRERVFRFLTTEQRLDNADSFSVFLTELMDPSRRRVPSTLSDGITDVFNDCGTSQPQVGEALAWAQRWNTYAMYGSSQTYTYRRALRRMRPHLRRTLGRVNRYDMAGIYDHYQRLKTLFRQDWTFNCLPTDSPNCAPDQPPVNFDPTSEVFTVCPSFYSLDVEERTILMYVQFTRMIPQIRDDQRRAYARLARSYMTDFFHTD